MPMLTTSVIGFSVKPRHRPLWMRCTSSVIWPSTRCTSGITSTPLTRTCSPIGRRSAVCSAGRFSEAFTGAPANSCSMAWRRFICSARSISSAWLRASIRFFE